MRLRADVSALDRLCYALLLLGALNWGFVGIIELNLVMAFLDLIFQPGVAELLGRVLYGLIGLAGLYFLYPLYRISTSVGKSGATGR